MSNLIWNNATGAITSNPSENQKNTRTVFPPHIHSDIHSSQLLSVEVEDGEEVQWMWTHYPNGTSIITGYSVIKEEE